ncbi:unnamed protein product, partial [Prorocentrum cordatum]
MYDFTVEADLTCSESFDPKAKPAAELDGQQGLCTELGASCSSSQSPSWPSSSSPQWRRGPPASPFTAAREAERSDRGATWWHKEAKQRETAQQDRLVEIAGECNNFDVTTFTENQRRRHVIEGTAEAADYVEAETTPKKLQRGAGQQVRLLAEKNNMTITNTRGTWRPNFFGDGGVSSIDYISAPWRLCSSWRSRGP